MRSVAYGQDGKLLVTAAEDGRVFLWDIGTLRPLREQLTGERVTSVALSADGTRLATGSADGIVRLWEVKSGRSLGEPLIGRLHSVPEVIFVGEGKLLAIESKDSSVVVWDADNRVVRAEISAEKNQSVTAVTVSLDGKRLAIGSTPGRWDLGSSAVVLWDLENRTPIGERILPRGRGVFSWMVAAHSGLASALGADALRPVVAYSVEKLLFRSCSQNCRPAEASFLLGRGGPYDFLLRATKSLLTNAPTIRRVNWRLQGNLARIRGERKLEFFNRIGRLPALACFDRAAAAQRTAAIEA